MTNLQAFIDTLDWVESNCALGTPVATVSDIDITLCDEELGDYTYTRPYTKVNSMLREQFENKFHFYS